MNYFPRRFGSQLLKYRHSYHSLSELKAYNTMSRPGNVSHLPLYTNFTTDLQWRIQDFPEVRAPSLWGEGGRQYTILPNFPKNCMKLKEFGPQRGGMSLSPPLDPPMDKCCVPLVCALGRIFNYLHFGNTHFCVSSVISYNIRKCLKKCCSNIGNFNILSVAILSIHETPSTHPSI